MLRGRGLIKKFRFRDAMIHALDGVDLDAAQSEFLVLLGPSGCGKTTMLRSIAGLERPDEGSIEIDDSCVLSGEKRIFVPAERRPIGMVFQSYAVWPHMDVRENIAFPLREGVRRLATTNIQQRVGEVLEILQLTAVANRPVTTLSGGQQQRVALARALAQQPKVLLMDEPLSNLDFQLQLQLRAQVKDLVRRLGLTTIYVTHNQAEAMDLGDRIAVMNHGRVEQLGTPRDIYRHPRSEFVARFIGDMNLLPAKVISIAGDTALIDSVVGPLQVAGIHEPAPQLTDGCLLGIRPEDVHLVLDGEGSKQNAVRGQIVEMQYIGEAMVYTVAIGAAQIRAKVHHSVNLGAGSDVDVHIPRDYCTLIPSVSPAKPKAGDMQSARFTTAASNGGMAEQKLEQRHAR